METESGRCKGCEGSRKPRRPVPGSEWCRLHDPALAEWRRERGQAGGRPKNGEGAKHRVFHALPAGEPPPFLPQAQTPEDEPPRENLPSVGWIMGELAGVHAMMQGNEFVRDPVSNRMVRVGADPMAARVSVAALTAMLDGRKTALREKVEAVKIRQANEQSGGVRGPVALEGAPLNYDTDDDIPSAH